ncbi:MAG: hypothetical protein ACOC2W_03655 [bacterium]
MKIEVKYNNIVIGHTFDGKTIELLDSDDAKKVKDYLSKGQIIGVSSRGIGTNDNGTIVNHEITDYNIIKK